MDVNKLFREIGAVSWAGPLGRLADMCPDQSIRQSRRQASRSKRRSRESGGDFGPMNIMLIQERPERGRRGETEEALLKSSKLKKLK